VENDNSEDPLSALRTSELEHERWEGESRSAMIGQMSVGESLPRKLGWRESADTRAKKLGEMKNASKEWGENGVDGWVRLLEETRAREKEVVENLRGQLK